MLNKLWNFIADAMENEPWYRNEKELQNAIDHRIDHDDMADLYDEYQKKSWHWIFHEFVGQLLYTPGENVLLIVIAVFTIISFLLPPLLVIYGSVILVLFVSLVVSIICRRLLWNMTKYKIYKRDAPFL